MSKILKIILVCSLAANAVWAIGTMGGYFSSAKSSSKNAHTAATAAKAAAKSADALSPEAAQELKTLLSEADPVTLRDRLNAIGLPKEQVRTLVAERIYSRYNERIREINKEQTEVFTQHPYWQQWSLSAEERERQRAQQSELQKLGLAVRDEVIKVLGPDENPFPYSRSRNAFLPPEKAAQMEAIERDYNEMRSQLYGDMSGFPMPGDSEKMKLLEEEQRNDTLALLSPEEREMNDLRNSRSAQTVQSQYSNRLKMSEDEYKAVYALQKSLDDTYDMSRMLDGAGNITDRDAWNEMMNARSKAQEEMQAQIKDMVGPERWAEYMQSQNPDYYMLQAAARRFNLSDDTVAQTYQARTNAANEVKRISDDKTLSETQKNEAYSELSERAMNQIRATLGDDVGNAYIDRALPWLKKLPDGGRINFDDRGNVYVTPSRRQN